MSGALNMLIGSTTSFLFNSTISGNTINYVLNNALTSAGWNGADPVIATVTVASGVYVGSDSISTPAFRLNALPAGSRINLVNNGYILGMGGAGNGGNGGNALMIGSLITITNNGVIGGGGGGGGGGAGGGAYDGYGSYSYMYGGGGGGGAGYYPGSGGGITGTRSNVGLMYRGPSSGSGGSTSGGGGGGQSDYGHAFYTSPNTYMAGGYGGAGGGLGASGGGGNSGYGAGENYFVFSYFNSPAPQSGGSPGYCTTPGSNAYITWAATGTRYGAIG